MSAIEWTDQTWNPGIYGCEEISPACRNCYAARMAHRQVAMGNYPAGITEKRASGVHWTGTVIVADEVQGIDSLPKRARRRVFVTSMADLFHEDVPFDFIDRVFQAMQNRPHLTFQVLTKRPERAADWWEYTQEGWWRQHDGDLGDDVPPCEWPKNVWIGATVEDQRRAMARIPDLMKIPAPVRFVSCEPLVEGLDLTPWVRPLAPVGLADAPETWAEWNERGLWPEWVPQKWRARIESFWSCFGRSPRNWIRSHQRQGSPPTGLWMHDERPLGGKGPIEGRWVHTWNNMGILVDADGEAHVTSTPRAGLFDFDAPGSNHWQGIQWVIAGGESGPRAQPSHPDWFRSLRDQCEAAGVPFLFKQWGEWVSDRDKPHRTDIRRSAWVGLDGTTGRAQPEPEGCAWMARLGKAAAGRTLDGVVHDGFPR